MRLVSSCSIYRDSSLRQNRPSPSRSGGRSGGLAQYICPINWATTIFLVLILLFTQPSSAQTIDGSTPSLDFARDYPEPVEARSRMVDKIVAIVNDELITQSDVNRILAAIEAEYRTVYSNPRELAQKLKQAKENIVNQMVEERLILSEAKRSNIEVDEDRIQTRIEQIKKGFPNIEEFERVLATQGLTLKDLRDRFRDQEIMKKAVDYFVKYEIKVDPIEIKLFFKTHQQDLNHPETAKVASIFIRVDESCDEYEALQRARMILERLRKGEEFEDLAKAHSQGAMAGDGGNLGFIEKGQLIKEIDEAVFSLKAGEFTDVIKTPSGYRIFKVEEKEPKRALSFSEAQDLIEDILYKKKFAETFKKWIEKLKQDAYISIK